MTTISDIIAGSGSTDSKDKPFVISEDYRTVTIPEGQEILGCVGDVDVRRIYFIGPRYCDGTDMGGYAARVNYVNAAGDEDYYEAADRVIDGDAIRFSWLVGARACAEEGPVTISLCFINHDGSDIDNEFNTTVFEMPVLPSQSTEAAAVLPYSDAVQGFINTMNDATAATRQATQQALETAESLDESYQAAENSRDQAYQAAEAARDVNAMAAPFTIVDGKLCVTYYAGNV